MAIKLPPFKCTIVSHLYKINKVWLVCNNRLILNQMAKQAPKPLTPKPNPNYPSTKPNKKSGGGRGNQPKPKGK